MERVYHIQVLSKSLLNIYRVIKMLLDLVTNISTPGILASQVMIMVLLLHAPHQLFLTHQES